MGVKTEDVPDEDGAKLAYHLIAYEKVALNDDGELVLEKTEKTFKPSEGTYPTVDELVDEFMAKHENDEAAFEADTEIKYLGTARNEYISEWGPKDEEMAGEAIANIAGIKKLNDFEIEVTLDGFDATAVYKLGLTVTPLHYYGDKDQYDYEDNKFGFPFKDLSSIEAKSKSPMGAGPFKFIEYTNKVVYFEANEHYYRGEPKIKNLQFKETANADQIPGIDNGTIDITNPTFSTENVEAIKAYNTDNGELSGSIITTSTVDNLGYGYVGMNADTVLVDEPDSDASKNLRRALATVFAVYRDLTVNSYYGDRASVINYPISNTSWAAPQETDEGYEIAFSVDVDGNPIFTSEMSTDERYEAAKEAAIGFFKAAGYTFDDASGKFTAAPGQASLEYTFIIPATAWATTRPFCW